MLRFSKIFSLLILLLASTAHATLPAHLYAGSTGAQILDPTTKAVLASLPQWTEIASPYMLDSSAQPYVAGLGEQPYPITDGKLYVGVHYNGKTGIVALNSLTTAGPPQLGFRTPVIDEVFNLFAPKGPEIDDTPALNMVTQFHQTMCESMRPKTPQTMDLEIAALMNEWNAFVAEQKTPADQATAKRAREIDLVSRTVLFEAHNLGILDGEDSSACRNPGSCPISSCERDIIALSVRNRGMNPSCSTGHSYLGCKFLGDFQGVATQPAQYNIWFPTYTHPYIASCFLKPGLDTGHYEGRPASSEEDYKNRLLEFKLTLNNVSKVLYAPSLGDLFTYKEMNADNVASASAAIGSFQSYYHPQAMPGCLKDHMKDAYSTGISYVEKPAQKGKDYDIVFNQTIIPDPRALSSSDPSFTFQVEVRLSNTDIVLQNLEGSSDWEIERSRTSQITTRNECATMGLPHSCPAVANSHDFIAPYWSFISDARNAVLGCKVPNTSQDIEIGGNCDARMQLISGVN